MSQGSFCRQLLRNPRQVSAIAPSSSALCRMMVQNLPHSAVQVAELGPGTGVITREILRAGILPENLTLFELNPAFATALQIEFPAIRTLCEPAQNILTHCGHLDAIVSGLPLLSMPAVMQEALVTAAVSALKEEGVYIQFTYGARSPIRRQIAEKLGITHTRSDRIWRNLPPATVYVYRRARSSIPPCNEI